VLGPDGNVWFTNHTTRSLPNVGAPPAIGRINPSGQITEYRAGLSYASSPNGIITGPDGALWFTDRELHSIGRIVPSSAPANTFLVEPAKRARRNGVTRVPVTVPGPGEDSPRPDRPPFCAEPADPDTPPPDFHRHRGILRPGERPLRAESASPARGCGATASSR
jgi:hypothetical protein